MSKTLLIVDDEPQQRAGLKRTLLSLEPTLTILEASSAQEALLCYKTKKPALTLLDIELGKENGYKLLSELETLSSEMPNVIVVSGQAERYLDEVLTRAYPCLRKPVFPRQLQAHLDKLLQRENALLLHVREYQKEIRVLDPREVLYLHADEPLTHVHLKNGSHFSTSKRLGLLEKELASKSSLRFFRARRDYLVNLAYLKKFDAEEITIGTKTIPLAKSKYSKLKELL